MHDSNSFVTLTYSDEKLPSPPSLDVKHWQNFAKRARRKLGPFRFYHVGEYGDRTQRPHYHAILFGLDFRADRILLYEKDGLRYYTSDCLEHLWEQGSALITDFTEQTAGYVTGYITKKLNGDQAAAAYQAIDSNTGECFDIKHPYSTMSRRPGIGKTWLDKYQSDVYPHDSLVQSGRELPPPKYFDTQIPEELLAELKLRRAERAEPFKWNQTRERLEVRSTIASLRQKRKERELNINT